LSNAGSDDAMDNARAACHLFEREEGIE